MTKLSDHHFTMAAPVFAFDDVDPFFDEAPQADRAATRELALCERESPSPCPFGRVAPATINEETSNGNRR